MQCNHTPNTIQFLVFFGLKKGDWWVTTAQTPPHIKWCLSKQRIALLASSQLLWTLQVSASPSPSAEREQVCPLFVDLASSLKGAKQKKKNKRGQFTSPYFKMGKQS
ncbi:unnamed protein product [Rhizopus microsporus]